MHRGSTVLPHSCTNGCGAGCRFSCALFSPQVIGNRPLYRHTFFPNNLGWHKGLSAAVYRKVENITSWDYPYKFDQPLVWLVCYFGHISVKRLRVIEPSTWQESDHARARCLKRKQWLRRRAFGSAMKPRMLPITPSRQATQTFALTKNKRCHLLARFPADKMKTEPASPVIDNARNQVDPRQFSAQITPSDPT